MSDACSALLDFAIYMFFFTSVAGEIDIKLNWPKSDEYKALYINALMALKVKRLKAEQPMIGNLVRELRQAMNLSQEKFADVIGMTFPSINRWENGHAIPSPLALQQIDHLLEQLSDRGETLRTKHFPDQPNS